MNIKSVLLKNIFLLFLTKLSGYLLPLLAIPYLARVLGTAEFGNFAIYQSFALLASIFIEYGFSLSATRSVSAHRSDANEMANIFQQVNSAKIILSGVLFASVGLVYCFIMSGENFKAITGALVYAFAIGVAPAWYFQGIENLKSYTIIDILGKAISLLMVLFIISTPNDGDLVMYLLATGPLIASLISYKIAGKSITRKPFSFVAGVNGLVEGFSMFVFRAAISLYTVANVFLLGLFAMPAITGFYAASEKLVRGASSLIAPISQAIYPKMSFLVKSDMRGAIRLLHRTLFVLLVTSFLSSVVICFFAKEITFLFLGAGYEQVSSVLAILVWILPLIAAGNVLGIQWMLPLKLDKEFNSVVIFVGVFNFFAVFFAAKSWGAHGVAVVNIISEFLVIALILFFLRKKNVIPI
ncbi:oligosaccharide flippase family protein [Amphibiibacter pelophylacis]|uniref:Oligosaccharide flippase family protein n=1 Tax=Amphibiibacter pelophylacis TaxID=1799477 RepID=A0ACC6NZ80_9BURK